jgi:hypothetical protein
VRQTAGKGAADRRDVTVPASRAALGGWRGVLPHPAGPPGEDAGEDSSALSASARALPSSSAMHSSGVRFRTPRTSRTRGGTR